MRSRDPQHLHPLLRPIYHRHLEVARKMGLDVFNTDTFRDNEVQDHLYAQGRTRPGAIVTNARGGESPHNTRLRGLPAALAYDLAFVRARSSSGRIIAATWDEKMPWNVLGAIGLGLGLEWGHFFPSPEMPHFQFVDWRALRDTMTP